MREAGVYNLLRIEELMMTTPNDPTPRPATRMLQKKYVL